MHGEPLECFSVRAHPSWPTSNSWSKLKVVITDDTLFGVEKLPSDNHIRAHLDAVDPQLLRPVFQRTSEYLNKEKVLEKFRSVGNTLLVALDGTGYFSSESIHCDQCSVAHHKDGPTVYSHSVVLAAVVAPEMPHVIPLQPEFIRPQDGTDKQDCEQRAARRWLAEVAPLYSDLDVTLLGDALYATQPLIQEVLDAEMGYLFTAKEDSTSVSVRGNRLFGETRRGRLPGA